MKRYNVIVVYDPAGKKLLMCRRAKEPYKGMLNFVGGKIEPGETGEAAAYREPFEETGISRDDIILTHVMDFRYFLSDIELEAYSSRLKKNVALKVEKNPLLWVHREENFCDAARFAGECNIEHILQQVDSHNREALK